MNYKNSLIGCPFKMLLQLTVFHVHDLVSPDMFSLIKTVGDLGAMLWYSEINDLELYLVCAIHCAYPGRLNLFLSGRPVGYCQ